MLGSLNSPASSQNDQEEDREAGSISDLRVYHHRQQQLLPQTTTSPLFTTPTAIHIRKLLITCADLISQSNLPAAHRLLSLLSANSSPYGDSMERLVHLLVKAFSFRLNRDDVCSHRFYSTTTSAAVHESSPGAAARFSLPPTSSLIDHQTISSSSRSSSDHQYQYDQNEEEALQSCYLSLNQVTPFIRFSHLTANQAILEAIEVGEQAIHIIDFDIMHGVQWPPLMQALVERASNTPYPPPMLRITGTGHDLNLLQRTGDRLLKFAQSLGLRFQFHPLLVLNNDPTSLSLHLPNSSSTADLLRPHEALVFNCVLYLHKLLKEDRQNSSARDQLHLFLGRIKGLNPKIVTIAEREARHNQPCFMQRFVEALDYYTALFDSLEATLPGNSRERLAVEQIWFGREIMEIVGKEGVNRRERHERLETWEMILRSCGFSNVPLSPFALSQAKLLLRLHYPSEGYNLQILNDSFFLGWQNRALFSVSSWH